MDANDPTNTEPRSQPQSRSRNYWLFAIIFPIVILAAEVACVLPVTLGALGFIAAALPSLTSFSTLLFLAAFPAAFIFAAIGVSVPRHRRVMLSRAAACLCFVALWLAAFDLGQWYRHERFLQTGRQGEPIIAALAAYKQKTGTYPERFQTLVPDYIREIPPTGLFGYPDFRYRPIRSNNSAARNDYELYINCPEGVLDLDRFIYWPSEDYPNQLRGNPLERMGRWAYEHD